MQAPGYVDYASFYGYPNPALLANYSPVASVYPHPLENAYISDNSPPSDPGKLTHRSPEEMMKYREKRNKNNEAAKSSRRKRSEREKDQQEKIRRQDDHIRALTEENTNLRAFVAHLQSLLAQKGIQEQAAAAVPKAPLNACQGEDKENVMPPFMAYPQQLYDNKY